MRPPDWKDWNEETRYQFDARAAICEFDGGMTRDQAEAIALEEVKQRREQIELEALRRREEYFRTVPREKPPEEQVMLFLNGD